MTACPVCDAPSASPFLVRDPVPVHQNLLVRTAAEARALNRGRLSLHACATCGFVFNAAFDPAALTYGAAYDNTQSCSPAFEAYLQELADYLIVERGLRQRRIVEIGCGKGGFLRSLVTQDIGNQGIGFDPSYAGPEVDLDGRLRFERRFFDQSSGNLEADVVVCRHVIEHIAEPLELLRTLQRTLEDRPVQIFFETPCVEWILANRVMWDFFYEHCSYFTPASLRYAFERAGFAVEAVRHVFGGQYLWIEARTASAAQVGPVNGSSVRELADAYAAAEASQVAAIRERLVQLNAAGPVAMWGAAAKGVTLANLVDADRALLACVVDLNPNKQGGSLPGTGHPIIGPHQLPAFGVRTAVVTNPNYMAENARMLRDAALDVRLVDLMHPGTVDAHTH